MKDHIKKLAIGTAQFGMNYGIANTNGQIKQHQIDLILELASKNGIFTLDTAKCYGDSEENIGKSLQKSNLKWEVVTKITDLNKNIIEQFWDSEKKLSVQPSIILAHSIDIFLSPTFQKQIQDLKQNGLINKLGVSVYSDEEIKKAIQSDLKPQIIQLPINILDTSLYDNGTLQKLYNANIQIHARSVFLQGLFYLSKDQLKNRFNELLVPIEKLKSISKEYNLTLSELSLLWLLSLKEINKVIIGIDNTKQLKMHLSTVCKNVNSSIFDEALKIRYNNSKLLNPSLWNIKY